MADLLFRLPIGWIDVLDILSVAFVVWALIAWLRRARARLAFIGVAIAGGVYMLAQLLGLGLTAWIFQGFFAVLVIVMVVVFQEDLRRLFEQIAVWGLRRRATLPEPKVGDALVRSALQLAETRTGALIVIPGREPLERHLEGGIPLDALVSEPLLLSLFDASSPGHDGAVLISGDRISRFAVHLPLSTNEYELGPGGTRHAAGLGLSELADCLCIVISEERGTISLARDGRLHVLSRPQELLGELERFAHEIAPASAATGGWHGLLRHAPEAALALLLAGALWVVRVPGSSLGEIEQTAPVVVDKLPADLELESIEPAEVVVRLRGLRRDLFFRSVDPPSVRIDALLAKLGRRTFQLSPENVAAPPDLEAVSIEPDQVRISVRARGDDSSP